MNATRTTWLVILSVALSACFSDTTAELTEDAGADAQIALLPFSQQADPQSVMPPLTEPVRCDERTICFPPVQTAREACNAVLKVMTAEGAFHYGRPGCALAHAEARTSSGALRRAALLVLDEVEWTTSHFVAFAGPDGYDRVVDFMGLTIGLNESEDIQVTTFALEDLVPGGARELHVEIKSKGENHDCTGERSWAFWRADMMVCGVDSSSKAYCLPSVPRANREVETIYDPQTQKETRVVTGYAYAVRIEDGNLIVKRKSGRVPDRHKPLLGTHPLLDQSWHSPAL